MKNNYVRLTLKEREEISECLWLGKTFTEIALLLNRSTPTISREVNENCKYKRCYRASEANEKALQARHRQKQNKKLDKDCILREHVIEKLKLGWSPEEIAKRLKIDYPNSMSMRISHESIYSYLYCLPRGSLKKELFKCLRHKRKLRRERKLNHSRRSTITDFISISERPKEVETRIIPGHWEGDLIMGSKASNSALGTLVERTTRYLLLVPLKKHNAMSVRCEFSKMVKKIPKYLKKSLTYDRGTEMAEHKLFTKETKIQVYFADPYSPWQRGTNENTNGLIRQFFPKGIDFNQVSVDEIKHVQDLLNDRPRKVLNFLKPNEVYAEVLTNSILR